jgi:Flp pilus assembly protein TadG
MTKLRGSFTRPLPCEVTGQPLQGVRSIRLACAPRKLREALDDKRGAVAVIAGLALPALLGFTALGTEASYWWYQSRAAQGAADAAALSAAAAATAKNKRMLFEAHATAAAQGFAHGVNGVTVTMNSPPSKGTYAGEAAAVEVVVSQNQERLFSRLFAKDAVLIAARSVALEGAAGTACVLALNGNAKGALKGAGTTKATLNGCGLAVNSNDATALETAGGAIVTADSADIVGGISGTGLTAEKGIHTGTKPTRDPYADVAQPSHSGCDKTNFSAKNTVTMNPGVYCKGVKINAGAVVTLNPGVYFFDGDSLSVAGGATITGTGVTLVFTGDSASGYATATVNGGANVHITAPTTGPLAGIAVFGDRAMPAGSAFTLNGGGTQDFTGAIYLPKAAVTYAGGAKTGKSCTQLVGDTIEFKGNAEFELNCSGTGTQEIGTKRPSLVE